MNLFRLLFRSGSFYNEYDRSCYLCGGLLLNFDGLVDGTTIDPDYELDELDKIATDANAVRYDLFFYGWPSVASTDAEKFEESDLPPTYFLYGSQ